MEIIIKNQPTTHGEINDKYTMKFLEKISEPSNWKVMGLIPAGGSNIFSENYHLFCNNYKKGEKVG